MKNIFEFTNEKNGYSDILTRLKNLTLEFNGNNASSEGSQYDDPMTGEVYTVIQNFYKECDIFRAPILYIWGNEMQEFFNKGNEYSRNFITEVNKIVADGNLNCLLNIAAEEHHLKLGVYPEWLYTDLRQTEAGIKNSIINGDFEGLNSELYNKIIEDFQSEGLISIDETKNTYQNNIANIKNYILNVDKTELSFDGKQLFESFIPKLFESAIPMMDLKDFKTNAQKIAPNDTRLMDIFKFVKKEIGNNPSINVLMNIAKEEHLQNTNRVSSKDEADDVIKSLGDIWTAGDTELEQMIKNNAFKNLKSNLAMQLTLDLQNTFDESNNPVVEIKDAVDTNEKFVDSLFEAMKDIHVANPIGIMFESEDFDNKLVYVNDNILEVIPQEDESFEYQSINQQVSIPEVESKLIDAFMSLEIDYENTLIKPKELWDFNISINESGKVILSDVVNNQEVFVEVELNDLQNFFQNSLDLYAQSMVPDQLEKYKIDADNFIMVAINFDNLTLLDDIVMIQSLNENEYVMVPEKYVIDSEINDTKMSIITSSSDKNTVEFPTYNELINNINKRIGIQHEDSVSHLFSRQLLKEQNSLFTKQGNINRLKEEQNQLNKEIDDKNKLLKIAEENSPAYLRLTKDLDALHAKLDNNLNDLQKEL